VSEKKEYIERGALLKAFGCENAVKYGNKNAEQQHKSYSSMMLYEIADEIYDAPAADVEPVVRGEWKESFTSRECQYAPNGVAYTFWYTCSNCGKKSRTKHERCLRCFAHMERSGSGE